ncbi:MAG TPA: enoyl-CoA hydratase-related protein [Polyangia bacterium]|nr:enoyl-CoA hydratase-related protein [Polyangia bacterium]
MSGDVEVVREDGVLRVTLNRPAKKNAITRAMYATLAAALADAEADPALRAVLFSGGSETFTAGNDLGDFLAADRDITAVTAFITGLSRATKPLIAAVSGMAVGIGATMLLHCDLVYVGRTASLSFPFLNLALIPECGSTALLPAAIGLPRATKLLYFGEKISGEEAARAGIVTEAVDDDQVQAHAARQARLLVQRPRQALMLTRSLLRRPFAGALAEAIQGEIEGFMRMLDSAEAREAVTAVAQKRPPDFSKL